jgi:hypothetical protein
VEWELNSVECCINHVEPCYSIQPTTGIAGTPEAESFTLSLVQLLHCPVVLISPFKLQPEGMRCQIAKIAQGLSYLPILASKHIIERGFFLAVQAIATKCSQ